jgi:hypothetical protein
MNATDQPARGLVVFTTIKQQTPPASGEEEPPPAPWWTGLTLDQQDELLNRIDPQLYGPGQYPPMAVKKWNREKRRVRRSRQRWIEEIAALRKPCGCENCRRDNRPPFPPYYVVRGISYECWLEAHAVDPELEEILQELRGNRERVGPAFVGHSEW